MLIREPSDEDLPVLTELYNHYVLRSTATFDTQPQTLEQRREWRSHYSSTGPHRLYVGEEHGRIVGYASSSPLRDRPAYDQSIEVSVYLQPDQGGKSFGRRLYDHLFAQLDGEPVHRAYAVISLPNAASVALHRRFGFETIGVLSEAGFKFGDYIDVAYMEKRFSYPH